MIRKAIDRQIKKQRLNIANLAPVCGISAQSLHKFICGKVSIDYNPAISLLCSLGLAFGYKRVGVAVVSANDARQYIANILTERNIKAKDLSALTGINTCTLSSWMSGRRQITLNNFELILKALGLEVLELA